MAGIEKINKLVYLYHKIFMKNLFILFILLFFWGITCTYSLYEVNNNIDIVLKNEYKQDFYENYSSILEKINHFKLEQIIIRIDNLLENIDSWIYSNDKKWKYIAKLIALREVIIESKDEIIIKSTKNISHIKTPDSLHSLYYNWYSVSNEDKMNTFYDLIESSEINSITIDIKSVSWYVNFDISDYEYWSIQPQSNNKIKDIKKIIEKLHKNNIYVIWRIVVFKDKLLTQTRPDLAVKWSNDKSIVWTDYDWNSYLDPSSREVWDYNTYIASAAYELWFDEINFDYIRFPTDWLISKTYYPFSSETIYSNPSWWKIIIIDKFSDYIISKLKNIYPDIVLSADVFWFIINTDIFQIWQNLESFLLNFDYVLPMIYPSHYSAGYLWYGVPDNVPDIVFNHSLKLSNNRIEKLNNDIEQSILSWSIYKIKWWFVPATDLSNFTKIEKTKIRPWIQGFNCSRCKWATKYDRTKFRKQIDAIYNSWLKSRCVWNSSSNYYSSRYWE